MIFFSEPGFSACIYLLTLSFWLAALSALFPADGSGLPLALWLCSVPPGLNPALKSGPVLAALSWLEWPWLFSGYFLDAVAHPFSPAVLAIQASCGQLVPAS